MRIKEEKNEETEGKERKREKRNEGNIINMSHRQTNLNHFNLSACVRIFNNNVQIH